MLELLDLGDSGLRIPDPEPYGFVMLQAAIAFLILALVAGVLGFTGIAGTASSIAQILFVVFLVLFLVGLVLGRRARI